MYEYQVIVVLVTLLVGDDNGSTTTTGTQRVIGKPVRKKKLGESTLQDKAVAAALVVVAA